MLLSVSESAIPPPPATNSAPYAAPFSPFPPLNLPLYAEHAPTSSLSPLATRHSPLSFVFNHFHDAPPTTPSFSIFCIFAGGVPTVPGKIRPTKQKVRNHDHRHPEPASSKLRNFGHRGSGTWTSFAFHPRAASLAQAPPGFFSLPLSLSQWATLLPARPASQVRPLPPALQPAGRRRSSPLSLAWRLRRPLRRTRLRHRRIPLR